MTRSLTPGWMPLTLLIAVIVVMLDQLVKWIIVRRLFETGDLAVDVAGSWLRLVYVENRGAAFGLFQGHSWVFLLLAIGVVSAIIGMAAVERFRPWYWHLALGLIIGGAAGNVIDRMRLGFVVDFVAVGPWPKFNVADAAISIGVVGLAYAILRDEPARPPTVNQAIEQGGASG